MNETAILLIIGAFGVLFHSLIKLNSLAVSARSGNIQFSPLKDYLLKDAWGIAASFASVGAWLLLFEEIAVKYPAIQGFVRTSFFIMGFMGSYLLQLALGRAKSTITKIIDAKTTQFDGTTEALTPLTKQAAKDITNGEV